MLKSETPNTLNPQCGHTDTSLHGNFRHYILAMRLDEETSVRLGAAREETSLAQTDTSPRNDDHMAPRPLAPMPRAGSRVIRTVAGASSRLSKIPTSSRDASMTPR